jgi:hypothetical protein
MSGHGQGPEFTGNYSDDSQPSASSSSADDQAAGIYGSPGDGTRMSRMKNVADEALSESPGGLTGSDNANEAFIDGSTVAGWKDASGNDGDVSTGFGPSGPNYPQAASTPGAPGFPGLPDTPASQGRDIKASKAVTAASNVSNDPPVKGFPGFPGLP